MRIYQHHIGDFNSATRHLTRLERSIYRDLIELYYDTEMPLQCERITLARKLLAKTDEELAAMDAVLQEFFTLEGNVYHHARCDEELEKFYAKSAAARVSAEKRWAKHAKKAGQNANAMRTHSEGNATRYPLPASKTLKDLSANADPVAEIFDHWVSVMGKTGAAKLTPKRKKSIQARLRDGYTLDQVKRAIENCRSDPWSMGENDRHVPFNDLELICRSGEKLESFINGRTVTTKTADYGI